VISPRSYNDRAGLCVACPITNRAKGYPFEVALLRTPRISGVVLADQICSLDWRTRNASRISRVPNLILERVLGKTTTLLGT